MSRNPETRLQIVVVQWLEACLPREATFWAVLNERRESAGLGKLRNLMGRRKGVSDLMVLHAGQLLCIELKTDSDSVRKIKRGYQSADQKAWQNAVEAAGAAYAVCRSTDDVAAFLAGCGVPLRVAQK